MRWLRNGSGQIPGVNTNDPYTNKMSNSKWNMVRCLKKTSMKLKPTSKQALPSEKEVVQKDFDLFQEMVVSPLHVLFAERITKATSTLDVLSRRLFSDAQQHSPNLPQEEGDEQAELLEKLTQLKWLFEARESLHSETYQLLSERNEKYKAAILLPYQRSQIARSLPKPNLSSPKTPTIEGWHLNKRHISL